MYYSGWFVPFPHPFATTVAKHGAAPLVQMDPDKISLREIAAGRYDGYLSSYAESVRAYEHPVIMSFGHEMNGDWSPGATGSPLRRSSWPPGGTSSTFSGHSDVRNVTWLWTVNIINDSRSGNIDSLEPMVARKLVREPGWGSTVIT